MIDTDDFTMTVPMPKSRGNADMSKTFGQMIVAGGSTMPSRNYDPPRIGAHVIAAVCFDGGSLRWEVHNEQRVCPPNGALLIDVQKIQGLRGAIDIALLMPTRLLPGSIANSPVTLLPASLELRTLYGAANAVLREEHAYAGTQAILIGNALIELLSAVLARSDMAACLIQQRSALFGRLSAHIDANLADDLDVQTICQALRCSRSAIYRATASVGGIATLIRERRLAAIYGRLCDPDEYASIADLGRAHGFSDAANLSNRFKRRYGTTARQLRLDHARRSGNA